MAKTLQEAFEGNKKDALENPPVYNLSVEYEGKNTGWPRYGYNGLDLERERFLREILGNSGVVRKDGRYDKGVVREKDLISRTVAINLGSFNPHTGFGSIKFCDPEGGSINALYSKGKVWFGDLEHVYNLGELVMPKQPNLRYNLEFKFIDEIDEDEIRREIEEEDENSVHAPHVLEATREIKVRDQKAQAQAGMEKMRKYIIHWSKERPMHPLDQHFEPPYVALIGADGLAQRYEDLDRNAITRVGTVDLRNFDLYQGGDIKFDDDLGDARLLLRYDGIWIGNVPEVELPKSQDIKPRYVEPLKRVA